jgi:Holliday junction resolvase RusA-like endonuclease
VRGASRRLVLVDSNRNAAPWAGVVSAAAADAMRDAAHGQEPRLMRAAVMVDLAFFFARPKSHFGTGRNAHTLREAAPAHMITMPDIDKLARCALDALTGVALGDDAQIAVLEARKRYGEPERLEVTVREL